MEWKLKRSSKSPLLTYNYNIKIVEAGLFAYQHTRCVHNLAAEGDGDPLQR